MFRKLVIFILAVSVGVMMTPGVALASTTTKQATTKNCCSKKTKNTATQKAKKTCCQKQTEKKECCKDDCCKKDCQCTVSYTLSAYFINDFYTKNSLVRFTETKKYLQFNISTIQLGHKTIWIPPKVS